MHAAVVDTDVVSMLFKGDPRADRFRPHLTGRLLAISFMTLAELERWRLERNWGPVRIAELRQHLTAYAVLPADRELCTVWARTVVHARREGRTLQTADAWIAATAIPLSCSTGHEQREGLQGFTRTYTSILIDAQPMAATVRIPERNHLKPGHP